MNMQVIQGMALFQGLPASALETIVSAMKPRKLSAKEILFSEGDPGQGLWVLIEGSVRLIRADPDGREQLLKIVRPHEVFSEVVLFDGGPYPATAIAAENGAASVLYNHDAEQLLQQHPTLAWHFLKVLSRRLRTAQERIRIMSATDVMQKLAATLLHLAEEQGTLNLTISQQDLANMLGVARETISRSLGTLSAEGIVSLKRYKVEIRDQNLLTEMANK